MIGDTCSLTCTQKLTNSLCSSESKGVTWAWHGLLIWQHSGAAFKMFSKVVHRNSIALVHSQCDQGIKALTSMWSRSEGFFSPTHPQSRWVQSADKMYKGLLSRKAFVGRPTWPQLPPAPWAEVASPKSPPNFAPVPKGKMQLHSAL